jgi:hypothetical protein
VSNLSLSGLAGERRTGLARARIASGDMSGEETASDFLDKGVGEFKFRRRRDLVKDAGTEADVCEDLSLRLADGDAPDGESPIALSLSPSALPGEVATKFNLLLLAFVAECGSVNTGCAIGGGEVGSLECDFPSSLERPGLVGVGGNPKSTLDWLSCRVVGRGD